MTDFIENLLAGMLGPLRDADQILAQAIDQLGQGLQWTGDEAAELAGLVDGLADKISLLQARLRSGT